MKTLTKLLGTTFLSLVSACSEPQSSSRKPLTYDGLSQAILTSAPSVVAEDLNGDGKLDVILGRAESYPLPYNIHFGR